MEQENKIVYTNQVASRLSLNDYLLGFSFSYTGGPTDIETSDIRIAMSPQHFKTMALMMLDDLKKYEELFGEISISANEATLKQMEERGLIQRAEIK